MLYAWEEYSLSFFRGKELEFIPNVTKSRVENTIKNDILIIIPLSDTVCKRKGIFSNGSFHRKS